MKKKCDEMMNTFLMLDKNERIPLGVTLHLLTCHECRNEVRLMGMAERIGASELNVRAPILAEDIKAAIMSLNPSWKIEPKPVSMRKWVVGGVFMIVFMLFFNLFVRIFGFKSEMLQLAFYLVFAGFVTFYCMAFVGANMDFFIKRIAVCSGELP